MHFSKATLSALIACFFLTVLLMTGCTDNSSEPFPDQTEIPSSNVDATSTVLSSSTPVLPRVLFLYSDQQANSVIQNSLFPLLEEFAINDGLLVQVSETPPNNLVADNVQAVFVADAGSLEPEMIIAQPEVRFFLFYEPENNATPDNVILVRWSPNYSEGTAFLAGYISAMITPDWRTGMIDAQNSADNLFGNFANGLHYYCGFCSPVYPPYYSYPTYTAISDAAAIVEIDATVAALVSDNVKTAFIHPEIYTPELITTLQDNGIDWISSQLMELPESARPIAILGIDPILTSQQIWQLVIGNDTSSELVLFPSIILHDPGLVSAGKLQQFNELIDQMSRGVIDPAYQ